MKISRSSVARERRAAAEELGFELLGGGRAQVRDALAPGADGEWLALVDRAPRGGAARDGLGARGPWKTVHADGSRVRVFDLWLASDAADSDAEAGGAPESGETRPPFASALHWARATADGELPAGWRAPEASEAWSWLGEHRLAVRSGALVAQARLVRERERLALRFPELVRVPERLPAERDAWLREVCRGAQDRYRLVRVGVSAGAVQAEVDLSGVPLAAAPAMVALSFAALAWVVEWLLAPLSLIANPGVASRALGLQLPWGPPRTSDTR